MSSAVQAALLQVAAAAVLASALSWVLTAGLLRYSRSRRILDVPNERSSHSAPTPRGGGLAIVAVATLAVLLLLATGRLESEPALALLGMLPIAAVGWRDDVAHVAARWRGAIHFAAAAWAVYWAGGMNSLSLGHASLDTGLFGSVAAIIGIAWCTNLYNFMDGIDGIAATEAMAVGLIGAALLALSGEPVLALVPAVIAGAAAGFFWWNRQPAKIFMGDVGSGALGYLFAVIGLLSENARAVPLLVWVLLAAVFAVDATITLIRRAIRGERWYAAHRDHAYQRVVLSGWSHAQVVGAVLALNAVLAVLAVAAWTNRTLLVACFLAGIALLVVAYLMVEKVRPIANPLEKQVRA